MNSLKIITEATLTIIISLFLSFACFAQVDSARDQYDPFALDLKDDASFLKDLQPLENVKPIEPDNEYATIDVPADHWAYRAVNHLIDIGLLGGYEDGMFYGDKPVTRYELSVIISKLVKTYNYYIKTGSFPPVQSRVPSSANIELSDITNVQQYETTQPSPEKLLVLTQKSKIRKQSDPETMEWKYTKPVTAVRGKVSRGGMKIIEGADTEKAEISEKEVEPEEKDSKITKSDTDEKKEKSDDKSKKDAESSKDKEKKKPVKAPKEFSKLEKKVELTEKDVEILDALIDYVNKDVIKDLKKEINKDIGEVKKISQRNKRDIEKLQENNQRFKITGSGEARYYNKDTDGGGSSTGPSQSLSTNLYSKPRKFDDMTLRSNMTSTSSFKLLFQDFTINRENPKNFKLRSLSAGDISFGASPFTSFGRDYDGFSTELKLNDYTVKAYMGRITSGRYLHAESVQFNLFGESRSWVYLTNLKTWDDASNSSYFPHEKNNVKSVYIRYPMPVDGLFLTTEYAHSTYSRPGFELAFPGQSPDYDPEDEFVEWIDVPEMSSQDDSYFLLFDYNKGPISIFPCGYMRLGPEFTSNYLGLPGFSADDLGIDLLPINLQSLQAFIIMGSYNKLEDHYKDSFLFARIEELQPMYFDTSSVADDGDMDTVIALNLFERLNNRGQDGLIDISFYQNTFTYYISDDISFSADYTYGKGGLGPACIDGNYSEVKDDQGNVIDKFIGNGIADCNPNSPTFDNNDLMIMLRFGYKDQSYKLYWRTSKKAEFSTTYSFGDTRINIESSVAPVKDAVQDLVDQGRDYQFSNNLKYRLTDVSNVEMWYNFGYTRPMQLSLDTDAWSEVGIKLYMSF
ncbi:MAG TPA: S-layer homology domain-containing protein [bacterium]|nr:S-layer homology domain-containing protein [bacterium]